jgi:DNA-binding MurR/RpiR family transcriptional regulator
MGILFNLQNEKNFTESDVTIARYILNHSDIFADLSIGELAKRTNTSNASVIRLCRKVGCKGFREFRVNFLRELERKPEDKHPMNVNYPVHDHSSPVIVMENISNAHKFAIDTCLTAISPLDIQKAAFMIHKAKNIFVYGLGESFLVGEMLARRLNRIGYVTIMVDTKTESAAVSSNTTEQDLAIFISYSGNGMISYQLDQTILEHNGCKTLLITGNQKLKDFDHIICYPMIESIEENAATYYSTEAAIFITDAIYSLLFAMDYEKLKKIKKLIDAEMHKGLKKYKDL